MDIMDVRNAEYESLRQEVLQNKKFVFERPLVLIGATGLAASQLSSNPAALILPALLVALLFLNLWFTVNRLRSTARIVAYICLVLESSEKVWIGWENALQKYRLWMRANSQKAQEDFISSHCNLEGVSDTMWFYHILLWLHIVPVCVGLLASGLYAIANPALPEIVGFLLTLVLSIVFAIACVRQFHPNKMCGLIDIQRVVWTDCLGFNNKEPNKAKSADAKSRVAD